MSKEAEIDISANPPGLVSDPEKAWNEKSVPEDFREANFMTRNGLNLESFSRQAPLAHDHNWRLYRRRFFVGSGSALTRGGSGSVLICFLVAGVMIFNVVHALGELAVMYPVSGGFYTYSTRFIDPSWGFAMGWNYVFMWLSVLPLELTVCSFTVQYWNKDISPAVWISVFWGVIIIVNIFGTLGYAEEELWSSCFKLAAVVIFMIVAVVLICGGGPKEAVFSFAGTELVGLAAAESNNPAKALPGAIKQVFWRITV
ncbi:amino acid permease-domain-containing protein [Dactylonectria macrodidyma]|uniref:Amino acid permease-domain-containing protein n=1 Tax=Dactylonectria macrodidyma TaxID=307937 RepID=A0A9P9J195_9HYPO|nr:amino acid permease-domain-containing protein [Dactylonectria macrodidyma]